MIDIKSVSKLVTPIAQKYGAERVALFGSRAKNTATETSDNDFVISKGNIQSLFQLASFIDELEKSIWNKYRCYYRYFKQHRISETDKKRCGCSL